MNKSLTQNSPRNAKGAVFPLEFQGYKRTDGKVGVRNHVVIVPGVACAAVAARIIAANAPGTVYLHNPNGCGQTQGDTALTLEILSGLIANGNVYGALIVGLGCEFLQEEHYREAIARKADKPVYFIGMQDTGSLAETVETGERIARQLLSDAARCRREPCVGSDLIVSLECGGSDPTSGFSSNAVLGCVSDRIVDLGGTTVMSETPEAIGAEHILKRRGRTEEIGQQLFDAVRASEKRFADLGIDVREANPSPGNMAGGITTLEEKSLGCIHKSGTKPFEAVYRYGETIDKKGLVFMDTPAYDVASVTAKTAAGAQVTVFTTGMGNPLGSPVSPVAKVTGNRSTYTRMRDIIDFYTGESITGEKTVEQLGEELLGYLLRVCGGETVRAEENGSAEIAINQFASYG
jgi:altronate dehydratase large subunit